MQEKAFLSLLLLVQSERLVTGDPNSSQSRKRRTREKKAGGRGGGCDGAQFSLDSLLAEEFGWEEGISCVRLSLSSQGQTLFLHRRCFYLRRGVCQGEWRGGGGSKKDHSSPSLSGLVRRRIANSIVGQQQYI